MVKSPCLQVECEGRNRAKCAQGCSELALYQRFLGLGITFETEIRRGTCVICGQPVGAGRGYYCEACRRAASVGRADLTFKYPRGSRGGGHKTGSRVYTLAETRTTTRCEYCGARSSGSVRVMCSRRASGWVRPTLHACIKCAKGDTSRDITIKNRPAKGGIYHSHQAIDPDV